MRKGHTRYSLRKIEISDFKVLICCRNFFDRPVNDIRAYDNIRKIARGQGDGYTTGFLLGYP